VVTLQRHRGPRWHHGFSGVHVRGIAAWLLLHLTLLIDLAAVSVGIIGQRSWMIT
jgi:hypothetical protein